MPRFDGTGPMGQGSMTGRGRGYCVLRVGNNYNAYPMINPSGYMPVVRPYQCRGFRMARPFPVGRFGRGRW